MSNKTIACNLSPELVLFPSQGNNPCPILVDVSYTEDLLNGKTGVVFWGGCVRAYLTFDPSGRQVISYTMAVNDNESQRSLENILAYI